jgi:hypothetical protein
LNNLLVLSREDAGAEGILTFDRDLQQIIEFIQNNERIIILGTIRVLASIAKNSYKRVRTILLTLPRKTKFLLFRLRLFITNLVFNY